MMGIYILKYINVLIYLICEYIIIFIYTLIHI